MAPAGRGSFLEKYRARPESISKAELVSRLRALQEEMTISWLTAGARFFGWADINIDRDGFISQIRRMGPGSVHMSAHVPGEGSSCVVYEMAG